jgi:putative ABC transport system substrate-binding protein
MRWSNEAAWVGFVGGAAATWPMVTERIRLIGVLGGLPKDAPPNQPRYAALLQGLRELGWIEGKDFRIEYRWVTDDVVRMHANVQELVKLRPDLLLSLNANPQLSSPCKRKPPQSRFFSSMQLIQ